MRVDMPIDIRRNIIQIPVEVVRIRRIIPIRPIITQALPDYFAKRREPTVRRTIDATILRTQQKPPASAA